MFSSQSGINQSSPPGTLFLAPSIRYASELIDALDAHDDRHRFRLQSVEGQLDVGLRLARMAPNCGWATPTA